MNNTEFLDCILQSFKKFLATHSRSNQKLKILHGGIAKDLSDRLGSSYTIKSLGLGIGKEEKIQGRYINKIVDITVLKDDKAIAGIGVKFVMQNYSQNSNNYFENMLGETANIRCQNIPYFQIFIIPDTIPYYKDGGVLEKWESFTTHNIQKYQILSTDPVDTFVHTPTKTLLCVIKLPRITRRIANKKAYTHFYQSLPNLSIKNTDNEYGAFSSNVIFNNYEEFITKVVHRIKSE